MATKYPSHLTLYGTRTGQSYKDITNAWSNCTACPLHSDRRNIVHIRGQVPSQFLFIGEAPGEKEDAIGYPMFGPTRPIIERLAADLAWDTDYAIVNIVACRPPDNRKPRKSEAEACQPRLTSFIKLASPSLAILMGATAQKYATPICKELNISYAHTCHPSFINRQNHDYAEVLFRKTYLQIAGAVERYLTDAR